MNVTNLKDFNNSLLYKVIILFLGRLLPTLTIVIISIVYARQLSYKDYGSYQWILMYTNIAAIIMSFGLPSALLTINTFKIFHSLKTHLNKVILLSVFLFFALSTFIFSIDYIGFTGKCICLLLILVQSLISIRESILIKYKREKKILEVNLIYSLLFISWHLFQLKNSFDLSFLIFGLLLLQVLRLLILIKIGLSNHKSKFEISQASISKYILNLGINDTLNVLTRWIDKLVLVYYITQQEFAIFFNGTFEIPFISLLVSATGSIVAIRLSERNNSDDVAMVFSDAFKMLSNFIFPIFFFFLFFYKEFFFFIFSNKYHASLPIFFISIFILPVRINSYTTILQIKFKSKEIVYGSLIDLILALTLMFFLYPYFGLPGIAFAIVISTYVQATYYLVKSAKALKVSRLQLIPLTHILEKFFFLLFLFLCFNVLIINQNLYTKLILSASFTTILILILSISYTKNLKDKIGFKIK